VVGSTKAKIADGSTTMAANREVVQKRIFAKGFTRNFSVFPAFYKSTTLKRKPKFSTVRSTVGQDFDAEPRNSAQRAAKAKLRITSVSNNSKEVKRCAIRYA
jgi:hypothetical protein